MLNEIKKIIVAKKKLLEEWVTVSLSDILYRLESGSRPKGGVSGISEGIVSIGGEHLNYNGSFNTGKIKYIPVEFAKSMNNGRILENDILIVKDGATTGKTCFVDEDFPFEEAFVNEHVFIARTIPEMINSKYVFWYLWSRIGQNLIKTQITGTAQGGINQSFTANIPLPLPPLFDQQRIAKKLDRLVGYVREANAALEDVSVLLGEFRQKVLGMAVRGELTQGWRNKQKKIGKGKDLFDQLKEERLMNYKPNNLKSKENQLRTPKTSKFISSEISKSYLPKIPKNWEWVCLTDLGEIAGGVTKGRDLSGSNTIRLPYLRVANVQDGFLNLDEIKEIDVLESDLEKYRLLKGDILFTEGGDRDKLGRGTIWNGEIENCIHQNHIFRVRVLDKYISPEYISFFTKSEFAKDYFFVNAKQTTNLASINLSTLGRIPIALPPKEEQEMVIRQINYYFNLVEQIESNYKIVKFELESLPQSIFAKAFAGELTVPVTGVESATVLLDRIRTEKTRLEGIGKQKTKSTFEIKAKKLVMSSNLTIKDILQKTPGIKVPVKEVLEQSKYNKTKNSPLDMDGFYDELKTLIPYPVKEIRESEEVYLIFEQHAH